MRMRRAVRQSAELPGSGTGIGRHHCNYANFVIPGNKKHQAPEGLRAQ